MKLKFNETTNFVTAELVPESIEEYSQLLRFVNNAKKETPDIYLSFSPHNNAPYCNIVMKKVEVTKQMNSLSINNNARNKQ